MKNNSLFILAFLLLVSCNKDHRFAKGEIYQAEKKISAQEKQTPTRMMAQASTNVCANGEFTEERLLQDIRALENNKASGSRAIINGLDLSKFSASQASYIEKNRDWIQFEQTNFSDCSDLKCLFGKIYPNSDGYEGFIHYYFYLKMGYAVSTSGYSGAALTGQTTPEFNMNYASKDVLFSKEELKRFYYITKALGPSFQKLPSLLSIHRVPVGADLPGHPKAPGQIGGACGLAGGYYEKGAIILADGCLKMNLKNPFEDDFNITVTHEIAHRLDLTLTPNKTNFSAGQQWLDFSGWSIKENTDPATGKVTRQWEMLSKVNGLKSDSFVTNYSRTNTTEDFADSVSYARYQADYTEKLAPRKYEWIVKNIFGGKSYTSGGLTSTYTQMLVEYSIANLSPVINSCIENNSAYSYELNATLTNDYRDYDPQLVKCIFGGISQLIDSGIKELMEKEPEACGFFNNDSKILSQRVFEKLNDLIKKDLNKNIEISIQLQTLAEFLQRVNQEIDAREIYISCQDNVNPAECFTKQLTESFKLISSDYMEKIPNQLAALEVNFLAENNFINTKGKIVNLFSLIYTGSEIKFKEEAKRRWKVCFENTTDSNNHFDSMALNLYPYNGGNQYLKKSLINCINNSAEENLQSILDRTASKLSISITNPITKKFILEMYINHFTGTIQDLVIDAKAKEALKMIEKKTSITTKVINQLISDTSWVGSKALPGSEVQRRCEAESKGKIEVELGKHETVEEFIFHAPSDNIWKDGLCSNVLNNSKIRSITQMNQDNALKASLTKLTDIFMKEASPTMMKCKSQFSRENIAIIKLRNLCMSNPLTWNAITKDAVETWINKENLSFISSANKKGQDYLEARKTDLKNAAIKQMNTKTTSR